MISIAIWAQTFLHAASLRTYSTAIAMTRKKGWKQQQQGYLSVEERKVDDSSEEQQQLIPLNHVWVQGQGPLVPMTEPPTPSTRVFSSLFRCHELAAAWEAIGIESSKRYIFYAWSFYKELNRDLKRWEMECEMVGAPLNSRCIETPIRFIREVERELGWIRPASTPDAWHVSIFMSDLAVMRMHPLLMRGLDPSTPWLE